MKESVLVAVLIQLAVIVGFARLGGALFKSIGQPVVCGEIAAGLILGPSVLGGVFPGLFHSVFTAQTEEAFRAMSQVGLILLLFLIGIDFDFKHLKHHKSKPVVVSGVGIALPFGLGLAVGAVMHPYVAPNVDGLTFSLFVALALSITALPILGRIMIEFGLNRTPLGVLTITSAAIDDAFGWIVLALVTGLVTSGAQLDRTLLMIGETAAYATFLLVVARPLLRRWARWSLRRGAGELGHTGMATLLVLIFASAIATSLIGIFAIFGAFLLGTLFHDEDALRTAVRAKLGDFVTVLFLPIYFTYTGLRTDIGSMSGGLLWLLCGLVVCAGIVGKFGGCTLAARITGMTWRDAGMIGVLMNTRALMALIVINVGLDTGILTRPAFFMLVSMAVVTTYMTAPLLKRLLADAPQDSLARTHETTMRTDEATMESTDGRWATGRSGSGRTVRAPLAAEALRE
jgi:K+:H+ antiporter